MTTTLPNRIIKYFVDTSNPSQSGFYFYEKAGTGGFVRLGALADASRAGGNTFEIDSSTAEDVIYNGLGGADTYVVRSNLDKNIEISDPHSGDDGSGNEAKNTIVFDSDVTVTSISANQVTRLEGTGGLRIELTLDTGAVITVNGPDVFEYVVGGAAALDFAGFIATYGASGITPANRAPVFENVPTNLSIDENADGSAAPVSVGYVVASDADASDSLTYSIVSAVDQDGGSVTGFEVDGAGLITYVGTGLDAETITSVALTVSVSDGEESAQTSVAISVADLNDVAPTITSGATGNALTECVAVPNTEVIYAATGVSDITDITWTLSGPDAGLFNIDRATGEVRFNTETTPDHGVKDGYNFTVVATSGSLAAVEQAVTIAVTDIDEINASPRVTSNGDINAAVAGDVLTFRTRPSDPDFTYQWYRDGVDIAGATGARYRITEGDEGSSLYVVAHYTYGNGGELTVTPFGIIVPASVDNADSSSTATPSEAPAILSLADLNPASGFRIYGEAGWAVSSAGDVNGDGVDDFAIGTFWGGPLGSIGELRGSTYVVFGKENGFNAAINLRSLNARDGFRIDGENFGKFDGEFISAGDVNGDGYDDIIIAAYVADYNGGDSGATYVVFGKESGFSRTMDLSELDGSDGFRIDGESAGDFSGYSVATGDVNGDGYDDVIIGAQYADYNGVNSGSTYVVFGKESGFSRTTGLSELDGSDGFRIDGENSHNYSGGSVSSAGDVNGDGYDDIIVSARSTDSNEHRGNGSSYVIFGKESGFSRTMDLSELDGSNGFRMDLSGRSISSAGDINGDGYDDIIIGASRFGVASSLGPLTYVVFGKESGFSRTVDLSELDGSDGFGINRSGVSVSSAGDFNGDGYDDIIIGAPRAGLDGNIYGQSSYVVFGKESGFSRRMDLSELDGSDGFRIDGGGAFSFTGLSVSSAGDVNDDGYDDIMIGKSSYGTSYIIYGYATLSIDENADGSTVLVSVGRVAATDADASDTLTYSIVTAVDQNGDSVTGFEVDGAGLVTYVGTGLDAETITSVALTVSASDGEDSAETSVAISVVDLNDEAPTITSGASDDALTEGVAVPNTQVIYTATGTSDITDISWSLSGPDAGLFNINPTTGEVRFEAETTPDAEAKDSYSFTVVATSGALPSVTQGVTIEVTNVDEGNASFVVTSDGDITVAVAGDVLTVGLRSSDPDGDGAFSYQWYRDGVDIAGATGASYTITEADGGNSLYVAVRYTDGSGADETVTTSGVIVSAPANRAPVFENEPTDLSIDENADGSAAPVSVGRVVASDADASDTLTYSIVNAVDQNGDSVTGFEVDGTGLVTYVGTGIDAETVTSVALTVSASDGQESAQTSVAISVTNIDEGNASFVVTSDGDINAAVAGDVLTVGLGSSDPDGDGAFTYQWYRDGADIADATGASYTIPEDYEGNSIYVVVRYTDGSGADETVTASGVIVPVPEDNADNIAPATPPATPAVLSLADLDPTIGFRLIGEDDLGDDFGSAVSSVGDINGDGIDDFAIGAAGADPNGDSSGATYIVYGKANGFNANINLGNLDVGDGFRIAGERAGDLSGSSVSASDINGDGYNDIIIGAPNADPNGNKSGSTYVVFGKESGFSGTVDLSNIVSSGSGGVRINGENKRDFSGSSVSTGDVNGDGYDDIIIGAYGADSNGNKSGSTYVVFGAADEGYYGLSGTIELCEIDGRDGFRIDGENRGDWSGYSVSSAGDINGDGYDDIIIGADKADPNGVKNSGSTYVVFGKESRFSRTIDLSELDGSDGFRIDGESRWDWSGDSVSSAGDINGDGYDDIIIGADGADPNGASSGSTYVVFGKERGFSRAIDLSELDGSDGFRIDGESTKDWSGSSVSSAGDFNGDGYDDLIIGARYADPNGYASGSTYVVFGKERGFSRTIDLSELDGSDGFRIDGENRGDRSGHSVSSAGDINNDGYDDIIIGAPRTDEGAGYSYVIYGYATSVTNIDEGNASFVVTSDGDLTAAVAGDVLTVALRSSDPDGDGTFTYQWYRDGVDIAGATGASYTIPEDYDGNSIYVAVRYTDGSGADETVTASGVIVPVPEDNADRDTAATLPATPAVLNLADLTPTTGFRLDGENARDHSGEVVSSVGDINGDGYDDFAIGASIANPNVRGSSGSVYIVYGKSDGSIDFNGVELFDIVASNGDLGFRIDSGYSVDDQRHAISADDVNGDGYNDIIIGAPFADPNGYYSGSTYVVFGKESGFSGTIDLSDIVRIGDGFRIDGENTGDWSGDSVSAGDVNNDGYDDIIIGAPYADPSGGGSGSTYVVFGKENGFSRTMGLSELDGSDGFRIDGESGGDLSGYSVSAGDVNNDGYDDIIIGAAGADRNGNSVSNRGASYVVFGKDDDAFAATMNLSELDGSNGFRINGESAGDASGISVSSAGDINGDGYDDIIIGAPNADPNGSSSGSVYVVFGKESGFSRAIEPSELDGSDGFRINGESAGYSSGFSVSSAGDFNGDGYDDIIIGAHYADSNGNINSGSTYVVFGKESGFSRVIELSELDGSDGFRINGESGDDHGGVSVSSAGDINGDGYDDIIIGADGAARKGFNSGSSYIIYGHATSGANGITPAPANRAPVFENAPTDLSIDENADGSAAPVSVGRVVASDADAADTLTYSIVNAADQNGDSVTGFEVDGAGLITYVGTGLDAETITSVTVTVSASDGEDSAQTSVAISVTNVDEGNARFVVTSDGDINAAVAGDVLTVALRSSDPDGDGTFTYQWYRDGVDIAGATGASYTIPEDYDGNSIYVVVRYTDGSGADETITASGIIVPVPADNDDDASEDPVNITYTMTQAPTGVSLTRGGVALSVGETFTYQDIQGGSVALTVNDENALSGLRLTTDDGTDANPAEISLDIEVREVADIAAPEAGNDLDYSENEGSLVIDTGDYGDQITAAQGSDFITGGLGDDTINLDPIEGRETGQDTVVYNFGSGSIFTATDGGDDITGFKRGEDIFLLKTESDNPELATLDGLLSYVSGPDKGSSHDDVMIVTPNYVFGPEDGGNNIVVTGITGITLHFEDAGTYGGGYLAQGHVSITFDEQLDWAEFLSLIEIDNGDGTVDENFNYGRGLIRDLSALPNLMGEGSLAYEVEAPAQTPPQDVDVPLEDDIPATSFDVV